MGDKWDQSICSGFSLQSQPRLQDRIGAVAGNNQFLFFAERHNDLTALDTLSQPEVLSSLKCAGHDKIGMEIFHVGQNPIFEAYFNDEISDQALELYIMNSPTNLEEDNHSTKSSHKPRF